MTEHFDSEMGYRSQSEADEVIREIMAEVLEVRSSSKTAILKVYGHDLLVNSLD